MDLKVPAQTSPILLPEATIMRKIVLNVRIFKEAFFCGSNNDLVKSKITQDKFQEDIGPSFIGLSV